MACNPGNSNIERSSGHNKVTIPETEFGLGLCDSAYRPQTWSGMGKLFQQEILSDVMLMAEGQSIPCHKFLLAAASEYFYSRLVVETENVSCNLLEIEDLTFNALKVIVSYLYTGHINITAENAKEVIPSCKMLQLTTACDTCENFALEMVNPENCIGLYKMSTEHDIHHLSANALHVMQNNFGTVVSGKEFLSMSETDLTGYIQNENLTIPNEDPVFDAVVSWVRHKPQERKSSFSRLIAHVRLRHCSTDYLTQAVSKDPLMDNNDCRKILVAALIHHTAATAPDSSKQPSSSRRKGYAGTNTLITIGGVSDPGDVTRTECWRLEEAEWRVMEQCAMPVLLCFFSACATKEGIMVTGGYNAEDDEPVSQCWLLSTSTYRWRDLPELNTARYSHASVCTGGQVYVIGGQGSDEKEMASMECLKTFSGKWETFPDLPKAVVYPMAVSHGQYIYVFGGTDTEWNQSQSVFAYGANSKSWKTLADMPVICSLGSAVVWKDKIYIVGGFEQSCICYDPVLAQWSTLNQCRHEHASGPALVWKDRILVCGGRSSEEKRDDGTSGGTSLIEEGDDDDDDDDEEEEEEEEKEEEEKEEEEEEEEEEEGEDYEEEEHGIPGGTSVIEEYDPETDTWTVSQIELPLRLSVHFVFSTQSSVNIISSS